jgi:arylsulfatase A
VPDAYYDPMRARGLEPAAAAHFAMCKNIDDNVGRLLGHLERLGIDDNTIVVFLTDNGAAGRAAQYYNAGMRGWKTSTHEGGTRVPLFIRWPAAGWNAAIIEELAEHVDFYPTLADLAGVPMVDGPPVDGVSLRPLIEGNAADWPERILFTHNPLDETNRYPGAVRTPRYRLVCRIDGPQAGSQASNRDHTRSDWMLFDMKYDPGETTNIAAKHPDIVAELAALYEEWIDDVSAKGVRRWPIQVGHSAHNPVVLHASQAFFEAPVAFQVGGFAYDWLTHWSDLSGEISFELDVQQAGYYGLEIAYTCEPEDAGSILVVTAGEASASVTVPAFAAVEIDLPNRDEASNIRYRNREWGKLPIGKLFLPEGEIVIRMNAQKIAGGNVMDFKHLSLALQ